MLPVPSFISKLSTLADQTLRIQLDCNEIGSDQLAEIFGLRGKYGFFHFKEKPEEVPDVSELKVESWQKSKSQILRGVFYRVWEQEKAHKKTELESEMWIATEMDKVINHYKSKLN